MYNCHAILNNVDKGGGKSGILAEVSVFARKTGKNRHFCDLSQQVLSGVVAILILNVVANCIACATLVV